MGLSSSSTVAVEGITAITFASWATLGYLASKKFYVKSLAVVAHTPNFSSQEAEALWVQGQSDLQSKFQDRQGYTEKPSWKPNKKLYVKDYHMKAMVNLQFQKDNPKVVQAFYMKDLGDKVE